MKRRCALLLACVLVVVLAKAQYVSLKGKQFYNQAGQPFYPMICNYEATLSCNQCAHGDGVAAINDIELAPNYNYGSSGVYEFDFGRGKDMVAADFALMKSMGFNTVRVLWLNFNGHDYYGHVENGEWKSGGADGGRAICQPHSGPQWNWWGKPLIFHQPYERDRNLQEVLFPKIKEMLDIAWAQGLNVILLSGGNTVSGTIAFNKDSSYYYRLQQAKGYASYLHALGKYLNKHPALLAYDLYNEPVFGTWGTWGPFTASNKAEIKQFSALWYDSLKQADPNHLITMSNWDIQDLMTYDPTILKLDFNSFHIYPAFLLGKWEPADKPTAMQRFNMQLYWINKNCRLPWIISETAGSSWTEEGADIMGQDTNALVPGFTQQHKGKNLSEMPFVWGSYQEHARHILDMQQAIVNYGGSGFGYWGYMEVNTDINLEGYDAAEISFGKHEGILNVADARWQKGKFVYDAKAIKPFAQNPWNVFGEGSVKQATASASKPADYNRPFGQPKKRYYTYSGYIKDATGRPVADAIITGTNAWGAFSPSQSNRSFGIYCISDSAGYFELTAPFSKRTKPGRDAVFFHIRVSAAELSCYECDNRNRQPRKCPRNGATIVLSRVE